MKQNYTKSRKRVNSLELVKESLDCGTSKETSKQLDHQVESGSLISQVSMDPLLAKLLLNNQLSCIQESLQTNKEMISRDNNNTSNQNCLLSNLPDLTFLRSKTLDPESISRGQDFYEFWDLSKKERYQELSWLQETDLPDLESNLSNGSVQNLKLKSWFSIQKIQPQSQNLETTLWPLSKFIVADGMEEDAIKQKETTSIIKVMKLKLNPTKVQKEKLNQWAGCSRYLYNKTIGMLTNKSIPSHQKRKYYLRDKLVTLTSGNKQMKKVNNFFSNKKWLLDCPKAIRQWSIFDAQANLQSCFTNKANGNIKKFRAPFKTKKNEKSNGWAVSLDAQYIQRTQKKLFICPTFLSEMKYFGSKQLMKLMPGVDKSKAQCEQTTKPKMTCKIQKNSFNEYFLVVPYEFKRKQNLPKTFKNPVSIDPGVRKFLVSYSPTSRESLIMGNRWSTRIMQLLIQLDSLYSEQAKETDSKKKKSLKAKITRLRKTVCNLKQEMRYQCANYFSKTNDLVLMPKLKTGDLSIKANRKLTTKTVRAMMNAGHGMFFNILKRKCWEQGTYFLEVPEHYTSKTCPCCGHLNVCNEVYSCKSCKFRHDRDMVGALNIFLRAVRS